MTPLQVACPLLVGVALVSRWVFLRLFRVIVAGDFILWSKQNIHVDRHHHHHCRKKQRPSQSTHITSFHFSLPFISALLYHATYILPFEVSVCYKYTQYLCTSLFFGYTNTKPTKKTCYSCNQKVLLPKSRKNKLFYFVNFIMLLCSAVLHHTQKCNNKSDERGGGE